MRSAIAARVLSAAHADLDHADPLRREWARFVVRANSLTKPPRTAPARVLPSEEDMPTIREILHARDEVYDPQPAVPDDAAYEALIRSAWRVPGSVAADGQATFFDPAEPIPTEPGELDETRHETEASGLIAVALMAAVIFGVPFAVWLWRGGMQ